LRRPAPAKRRRPGMRLAFLGLGRRSWGVRLAVPSTGRSPRHRSAPDHRGQGPGNAPPPENAATANPVEPAHRRRRPDVLKQGTHPADQPDRLGAGRARRSVPGDARERLSESPPHGPTQGARALHVRADVRRARSHQDAQRSDSRRRYGGLLLARRTGHHSTRQIDVRRTLLRTVREAFPVIVWRGPPRNRGSSCSSTGVVAFPVPWPAWWHGVRPPSWCDAGVRFEILSLSEREPCFAKLPQRLVAKNACCTRPWVEKAFDGVLIFGDPDVDLRHGLSKPAPPGSTSSRSRHRRIWLFPDPKHARYRRSEDA
jgi:hypothetical protein